MTKLSQVFLTFRIIIPSSYQGDWPEIFEGWRITAEDIDFDVARKEEYHVYSLTSTLPSEGVSYEQHFERLFSFLLDKKECLVNLQSVGAQLSFLWAATPHDSLSLHLELNSMFLKQFVALKCDLLVYGFAPDANSELH